jgi:hypothetical protein
VARPGGPRPRAGPLATLALTSMAPNESPNFDRLMRRRELVDATMSLMDRSQRSKLGHDDRNSESQGESVEIKSLSVDRSRDQDKRE